ncbi:MAG: XRE family transcriptional regulator [Magnetococcales bacterium]|nr:XRE family transcriptional regulator [Magnetococcales bacterium]
MAKPLRELIEETIPPERYPELEKIAERIEREWETLEQLRKAREFSQTELAQVLGTTQANISKMERRTDLYLSSLRNFVEALGGKLEIIATFLGEQYKITQWSSLDSTPK